MLSCKQKESVGLNTINNPSIGVGVTYVDTFSVALSTVLIDKLPTNNSTQLIAGKLDLGNLGKVTASTYFQLSLAGNDPDGDGKENILTYTNSPVYDSLVVVLTHDYSYGDTTTQHDLAIYKLNQAINYPSGSTNLYNNSTFTYDPSPLGSSKVAFNQYGNELHVKLSDVFGTELFDLAKTQDFKVSQNQYFKSYFNGLVLIPGSNDKSIYGYELNPVMRLYYHDSENPFTILYYDFVHNTTNDIHFNNITHDKSSTLLSGLTETYQEISSDKTNEEAYLLTGVELFPKITFPHLADFKNQNPNVAVNFAQLIIHPKDKTFNQQFYLPSRMVLYVANNGNKPDSLIRYASSINTEIVTPNVDYEDINNTYYTYDITDFMKNKLQLKGYEDACLLMGSLLSESEGRVEKLILDNNNQNYSIQLKLYLTKY